MKIFGCTTITMLAVVSSAWAHNANNSANIYPQNPIKPMLKSAQIELAQNFSCAGRKTCGQMRSCTEAYFRLKQCGDLRRDGDGDGIPCESICGKTHERMRRLLDAGL